MPKDMSFLPEDYLEKRIAQRTNVICLTLFGVIMVGVIAAWFVTDRQRREVRTLQLQVNTQFEEAARNLEQLEALQQQKEQMLRKAKVTAALVEKLPRSLILAELINNMPATMSLTVLDLNTKELRGRRRPKTALQRAKQNKKKQNDTEIYVPQTQITLNLEGMAPTDVEVAQFIAAVAAHKMFDAVSLQFSEATVVDDRPMRKFRVNMTVNRDITFREIEPTLVKRELKLNPMGGVIQIDTSGQLVAPTQGVVADVPTHKGN